MHSVATISCEKLRRVRDQIVFAFRVADTGEIPTPTPRAPGASREPVPSLVFYVPELVDVPSPFVMLLLYQVNNFVTLFRDVGDPERAHARSRWVRVVE